ncbi:MAG: cytochrome-c peroxidase [Myxococcota bacterium]|nr:cytochrome-c peroxidase [Myxococcota bacterium]
MVILGSPHLLSCVGEDFPNLAEIDQMNALWGLPQVPEDPTNRHQGNPDAVVLGEAFFNDPQFSSCGTVSCASCHTNDGLTVAEALPPGCDGEHPPRNAPTILNVAYSDWFMWDGRSDRLWNQARLPLFSPVEMNATPPLLRDRLASGYAADYTALFGTDPSTDSEDLLVANFGKAIAAYEVTLNRSRSPFDQQLQDFISAARDGNAESHPLFLGMKTFIRTGQCVVCHKGPTLSDQTFHNIGLEDASEAARGRGAIVDFVTQSVFGADGPYSDAPNSLATNRLNNLRTAAGPALAELEGSYKTPSLRNVALTAPYMHTGKLGTLTDVVEFYNRGGDPEGAFKGVRTKTIVPLELTDQEKQALVDLMESMTGALE